MSIKLFQPGTFTRDLAICLVVLAFPAYLMGISIFIIFLVSILILGLTDSIDKKAKINHITGELEAHGFVTCTLEEVDPDLIHAMNVSKADRCKERDIKAVSTGTLHNREIVLFVLERTYGENEFEFIACGVWSPVQWSKTAIKPKVELFDSLKRIKGVGDTEFDHYRKVITEDPELMFPLIKSMRTWFPMPKNRVRSLRLSSGKPDCQSWIFDGHWLFMSNNQIASAENFDTLTQHMCEFADAFETILLEHAPS